MTRDRPSSFHCKALSEVVAALSWLSIDFRVTLAAAAKGKRASSDHVSDRYPVGQASVSLLRVQMPHWCL